MHRNTWKRGKIVLWNSANEEKKTIFSLTFLPPSFFLPLQFPPKSALPPSLPPSLSPPLPRLSRQMARVGLSERRRKIGPSEKREKKKKKGKLVINSFLLVAFPLAIESKIAELPSFLFLLPVLGSTVCAMFTSGPWAWEGGRVMEGIKRRLKQRWA